ncbi:hypothetical protein NQ318_015962 [Aromia moschata]|uniref:Uncharacterized protein n=1 Tax=Aromia moschata TaxID=1265417 RepID=A0AAV8X598_9CUCU|nr:hypothetical protein NQ318_015962 [Aromia moschata]
MEKFLVIKDTTRVIRRFNLRGRTLEFKLKPVPQGVEPLGWVKGALEQVIDRVVGGVEPNDKIGFTFCSKSFNRGEGYD